MAWTKPVVVTYVVNRAEGIYAVAEAYEFYFVLTCSYVCFQNIRWINDVADFLFVNKHFCKCTSVVAYAYFKCAFGHINFCFVYYVSAVEWQALCGNVSKTYCVVFGITVCLQP